MIKLEHFVGPSPEQMRFIIDGMRNPKNSWDKSDSICYAQEMKDDGTMEYSDFLLGEEDHKLMMKLAKAGTDHRKYLRMIPVYIRITAPLYWWKEFDTYKVGTVANSCSTMHTIAEKEFTIEDFSTEHLSAMSSKALRLEIRYLESLRDAYLKLDGNQIVANMSKKDIWWQMIQLLPSSYNQTRNVMMNYEVLANIYKSRKNHKLDEWRTFCKWIEMVPWSELICQWPEEEAKKSGWIPECMNKPLNEGSDIDGEVYGD